MSTEAGPFCEVVERDFVAAWWLLAEAAGADLHEAEGLRWYASGRADPYCTAVLVTRMEPDVAEATIERTLDRLRTRDTPFTWWLMPSAEPADLGSQLEARGLVADRPWRGMAARVADVAPPPRPEGLDVRRVASEADLASYVDVFAPILSPSDPFTAYFVEGARRIGFAEDAPEVHLLGLLDGEPVATTSLLTAGGAAGIYNVTTVEAARRRGIGAAMTAAAIALGRARGMSITTLQASEMGRPVYERLGFLPACDLVPYRYPETAT